MHKLGSRIPGPYVVLFGPGDFGAGTSRRPHLSFGKRSTFVRVSASFLHRGIYAAWLRGSA